MPSPAPESPRPARRFRIAFSFAGEKRDFVKEAARILAQQFGEEAILYDKFHEAEFANADLALDLPDLYKDHADLIVAVFCPDYERKEWCGLEWRAIFSMIKEQKAKQVLLTRFDHTLIKGLHGIEGFIELDHKTPEQLVELILQRLALNEGKPKTHYTHPQPTVTDTKRPHPAIPHNLPRLQPFFGREKELEHIRLALESENRTWGTLIDGVGGMGKTSLAIRAALECKPEQFERIVFVSIKQRELDDDGLRDLSVGRIQGFLEMLNEVARELGHADITKSAESDRIRLVLEALRPTRTLLILDNLESLTRGDRDQIFSLVKRLPQACKAILTSRGRIGSGSEELILEKLDEKAALETLADLAKHNPVLAKTNEAERLVLYKQTGGKPLLLRWTAGQIGRGHCRTFTDAIEFLRSCPAGNDPLEFIFGDLVQDFSPEETLALCALSHFTLPAKVEHIAMVADSGPVERISKSALPEGSKLELRSTGDSALARALRSLTNRSLVVPDVEEQHYTLVPLVADFLRQVKPEIIAEAGERLEARAFALAQENGGDNYESFPRIDAAWPALAAALPRFLAGPNDRLQALCDAFQYVLYFQGRGDEWLALAQSAESKALAAQDFYSAGWRAGQSGWMHSLRGQAAEVLACAERAASHWVQAQAGARERATGIRLCGKGHDLAGDYSAAITAYQEAVDIHRSLQAESVDVCIGLNSLASAERRSGELEAAEADYREALRIAQAIGHREGIALYTGNLASLALDRQDWPEAEALAREALPLAEKLGRQDLIGSNSYRLSLALLRQGRAMEGLPFAERAVGTHEKLGHPDLAGAQSVLRECQEAVK
jgi:tetratricopeptide (TPR) repeat protein